MNSSIDALRELLNIGVGRAASVLNTMLNSHIKLQVPLVKIVSRQELKEELESVGSGTLSSVNLPFRGIFSGNAKLIFPAESALKLVVALTGEEPNTEDLDTIRAGTLAEIGNIVLNSVMGSISNMLKLSLDYSVPNYHEGGVNSLFDPEKMESDTVFLIARTSFTVEKLNVDGDIVIFFEVGSFEKFIGSLNELSAT
jgi:chemotaxis protein CheC